MCGEGGGGVLAVGCTGGCLSTTCHETQHNSLTCMSKTDR
jgi:hypothetical protein